MAITAHYLFFEDSGELTLCSQLLAFRWVPGSHAGVLLGDVFVQVLDPLGLLMKVCLSNCILVFINDGQVVRGLLIRTYLDLDRHD